MTTAFIAGGIGCQRLSITCGRTTPCPELDLEVHVTTAGAAVVRSTGPDETERSVLAAGSLQLVVGRDASDVGAGDVVAPLAPGVVGQTLATGVGSLTLTDHRALGLVWSSNVDARSLAASLDEGGTGSVLVFAVERSLLRNVETKTSLTGDVRSAQLTGACFITLDAPFKVLDSSSGSFVNPPKGAVATALGGSPTTSGSPSRTWWQRPVVLLSAIAVLAIALIAGALIVSGGGEEPDERTGEILSEIYAKGNEQCGEDVACHLALSADDFTDFEGEASSADIDLSTFRVTEQDNPSLDRGEPIDDIAYLLDSPSGRTCVAQSNNPWECS